MRESKNSAHAEVRAPYIERPRFSCTLGGALSAIHSLPRTVSIIHASSGCGNNLFTTQQVGGGAYGAGHCGGLAMPSSNVSESEIIFGGEDRLKEQIEATLELIDADLFVVVTGCMVEIIGDDPHSVQSEFRDAGHPVLAVKTGGFAGNSYKGYDLVLQTLFTDYVEQSSAKDDRLVNIWGVVPGQDPFFRGDLAEIKRLLALVGIRANTFFTYDETLENLKKSGKASLNIILSRVYGIDAAEKFKRKHGTPYIVEDIPIGVTATSEFLHRVAEQFNIDKTIVDGVVADETRKYYAFVERIADTYFDADFQHYAIVVGNANYCLPLTRFIASEIGWLPELSVITDSLTEEQKTIIRSSFADFKTVKIPDPVFETNASEIQPHFTKSRNIFTDDRYAHKYSPLFVFGSYVDRELAENLGAKKLSVSFPLVDRAVLDRGYAGFKGGLNLLEDILNTLLLVR